MRLRRFARPLFVICALSCSPPPPTTPPPPPAPPPVPAAPPPPVPVARPAIVIMDRIAFDSASPLIRDSEYATLNRVAELLQQNPHVTMVEIHGHTDDGGEVDPNLLLSQQRAEAVRGYLVNKGVSGARLRTRAFGKTIPIAPNDTPDGRAQNRRVDFRIVGQ